MKQGVGLTYYPVFLKVKGRKCTVVGGGEVALRKVRVLLEHGADVEVVSPDLCSELAGLAGRGEIRTLTRKYRTGDLKNTFVAIAATGDGGINRRVVAEARRKKVLVNTVDDAENSDFIVPSYLRRGDLTVAVATGGKSPALARKIRTRLEKEIGEEYKALTDLIGEVRARLKQQKLEVDADGWQEALDLDRLLDLVRQGDKEKARATLLANLKANQR